MVQLNAPLEEVGDDTKLQGASHRTSKISTRATDTFKIVFSCAPIVGCLLLQDFMHCTYAFASSCLRNRWDLLGGLSHISSSTLDEVSAVRLVLLGYRQYLPGWGKYRPR